MWQDFLFFLIEEYPTNKVRVSGGKQRDSAKHIHVSILPQTPLSFRPYNTEENSLCYTV